MGGAVTILKVGGMTEPAGCVHTQLLSSCVLGKKCPGLSPQKLTCKNFYSPEQLLQLLC